MEDDWEQIADGPAIIPKKVANVNKWDGEDEEEDIKDSWEDEENDDEEKKDNEKLETIMLKTKPKKTLQEKIAEKERLRAEEEEARIREMEENMTPEEKIEHKLKLQKIQEESDLKVAMETFGLTSTDIITGIDEMNPTNTAELSELGDLIIKKFNNYKSIEDFSGVAEEMIRNLCANLNMNDLQKIKKTLDNIYLEKQKIEKEKNKKGAKGKGRAKLRLDNDRAPITEYYNDDDSYADNYDDFM